MKFAAIGPLVLMAATATAQLPVRQVILYKHGVGYFERGGELRQGETARLDFKPSEMDDVLKSLTIHDSGGATISVVRYDSSQPLARRLEDFPFRLGDRQPLSAFLDTLKGARVDVRIGPETVTGAIVSARQAPGSAQQPEREWLTLLTDSGDIRSLDLSTASSLRFSDTQLQERLKEYLAIISGARSREGRSVYIESSESKQRPIVASYVIPMPVWKSSYRLILGPSGAATLEGWAIVDNVTSEDWNGVKLAVVSGRPISFISRLYEPRYLTRPEAQLPEDQAQPPLVHQGAIGGMADVSEPERELKMQRQKAGESRGFAAEMAAASPPAPMRAAQSSIAPTTEGRELGELFEYNFSTPVTVKRGESAMLPFLQQKISSRKLLIYSDTSTQHPMSAAELTNDTAKTLDGGPITVYDSASYAGEALMETLKNGDKRLISYAIDLGTRITTRFESTSNILREIHFRRGILTARQAARETRTYTIRNVDQTPKVLVLEHPARPGFQLVNMKPSESTANAYRFEVKLAPGAVEKFPVTEERVFDNTYSIANLTPDILASYIQNKTLSETARQQLEKIAQQKRLIAEADGNINRTEREISEMAADQTRLRQNIDSLNRVAGQQEQVQQYARQLAAQEAKLAAARDRLAALRRERAALESELNSLIEKMEF